MIDGDPLGKACRTSVERMVQGSRHATKSHQCLLSSGLAWGLGYLQSIDCCHLLYIRRSIVPDTVIPSSFGPSLFVTIKMMQASPNTETSPSIGGSDALLATLPNTAPASPSDTSSSQLVELDLDTSQTGTQSLANLNMQLSFILSPRFSEKHSVRYDHVY